MKKNVMKTMVATVCVVAANQSKVNMLLMENVEALSRNEVMDCIDKCCDYDESSTACEYKCGAIHGTSSASADSRICGRSTEPFRGHIAFRRAGIIECQRCVLRYEDEFCGR